MTVNNSKGFTLISTLMALTIMSIAMMGLAHSLKLAYKAIGDMRKIERNIASKPTTMLCESNDEDCEGTPALCLRQVCLFGSWCSSQFYNCSENQECNFYNGSWTVHRNNNNLACNQGLLTIN